MNGPSYQLMVIQGVPCHETGCPESWINPSTGEPYVRECRECGCEFVPESRHQVRCGSC
jgi:hypothetical protein